MKTIKKLFILPIVAFLGFTSLGVTNAYDDIDWEDLKATYTYNNSTENLNIKVYVDENSSPSDRYYAEFYFDGRKYTKYFTYSSSKDELYFQFSVNIDEDDLDDDYDINIEVYNDDEDDLVYDNTIYSNVKNNLDWDNVKVKATYNSGKNYLNAEVYLDGIDSKPGDKYYSYFEVNGKTHSAEFVYSSSSDKFYAKHSIYFNESDIDNNDKYYLTIKNNAYRVLATDSGNLDLDIDYDDDDNDYYYNDEDIKWSNFDLSNYYDEDDQKLKIDFVVGNVNKTPGDDYELKFKVNGSTYTKTLSYSSTNDKLYTSFYVNISRKNIRDYYTVSFSVRNKDRSRDEYTKSNLKMDVDSSYNSSGSKYKPKYYGYYDDEINWNDSKITNTYDTDYQNLQVTFAFNGVDYKPKNTYSVKMDFAGKKYEKKLTYNSSLNTLSANFNMNVNQKDIKNYYYVSYSVINDTEDDYVEFAKPIFKLSVFDEVYPSDFGNMVKDDLVKAIVDKAEENYYKNTDKIKYLERTITALTEKAKKETKYKDFISSVNASLKEKIKYYKGTKEGTSGNLFPMFDY